jgi:hypothetical protein
MLSHLGNVVNWEQVLGGLPASDIAAQHIRWPENCKYAKVTTFETTSQLYTSTRRESSTGRAYLTLFDSPLLLHFSYEG